MALEHFESGATADGVYAALVRDGACIVDDVLDGATLTASGDMHR